MTEQYKTLNDATVQKGCEGLALGRTEIWYMKREAFRKWNMGPDFSGEPMPVSKRSAFEKDHVLLGRAKETDPERLFMMLQGDMWSPQGEANTLIRSRGLAHTSMSVGDIIVVGGKGWMAEGVGFVELPKDGREAQEMFKKSQERVAELRNYKSPFQIRKEDVGSMRGLLRSLEEALTGRYTFVFKKVHPERSHGNKKLIAHPTKEVSVEIEYFEKPDRWSATIFDDDAEEEFSPDYIVGGQTFAKGLTQSEAEEAAIEITLKYLGDKRRKGWREP